MDDDRKHIPEDSEPLAPPDVPEPKPSATDKPLEAPTPPDSEFLSGDPSMEAASEEEKVASLRRADEHYRGDRLGVDQDHHMQDRGFKEESLKIFNIMARDLADDYYALHELRVSLETSRSDIADFGL